MLIFIGLLIFLLTVLLLFVLCAYILFAVITKGAFPKKLLIATLVGIALSTSIYIYESYFFTFDKINRESMQDGPGPISSPNEQYTAKAYYEPYGGAAGGVNVWVEITNKREKNKVQTVYYSDAKANITMKWLDDDTLSIQNDDPAYSDSNRSIELKIGKEIYDESGLACRSLLMKNDYETCYQNNEPS